MMRSKEIFTESDRLIFKTYIDEGKFGQHHIDLYNALLIAESEIEELREKLHNAQVELDSLIDLRPEN